ncbi:MAG: arginine repressor [Planctomycetota bacterium]|nr:arginine repressor [Planctomycetota bacterium]
MSGEKARRQRLIAELIEAEHPRSQEQLRELLLDEGIEVTQATLSRDLREVGVIKGPEGYSLPGEATRDGGRRDARKELERAIESHLLEADTAGNLVVLHTAPGHAQALAVAFDGIEIDGVVGTISGDDTIFIACRTTKNADALLRFVSEAARLE